MKARPPAVPALVLAVAVALVAAPAGAAQTPPAEAPQTSRAPQPSQSPRAALLVPSWDPIYRDLDDLIDRGLVTDVPVGQRPWSVRQIRRAAARAAAVLDSLSPDPPSADSPRTAHLRRLLARVEARVGPAGAAAADEPPLFLDELFVESYWADSPTRGSPYNGTGHIEDRTNPLLAYRHGRSVRDRGATALEPSVALAPHSRLSLYMRPRLQLFHGGDEPTGNAVDVQSLHARGRIAGVAVVVGRADVRWGRRPSDGLLLSGNARPLDLIHLSNDLPFDAGILGPARIAFFGADLGEDRQRPHAKLLGAKFSFRPHSRLEVAASFLNEQGGDGAPEASFWDRIADFFIVPDLFMTDRDLQISEKFAGMEGRWRVPGLPATTLFLEGAVTDLDASRWRSVLWEDAAWHGGAEIGGLGPAGAASVRVEGRHTGVRFYRHEQFPSGLTLDGAILGATLGPDGTSVGASGRWEAAPDRVGTLAAEWSRRSADVYGFQPDGNPVFPRLEDRPEETRVRIEAGLEAFDRTLRLHVRAGVERADGFAFDSDRRRTALFASIMLSRLGM